MTDGEKSSATGDVVPSGEGESVEWNEVLEYEKALDHLEDVEQKWGDKIQDYVLSIILLRLRHRQKALQKKDCRSAKQ